MKEAVKCCMQVWMCIRDFLAIVCTKEGEIVKKGKNEKEIRDLLWTTECKSSYRSIYKL